MAARRTVPIQYDPQCLRFAWAAGLAEGEGSLFVALKSGPKPVFRFELEMTDRDVVERFYALVGIGTVRGPIERGHKPAWRWAASGPKALDLAVAMFPFFGERRRARIVSAVNAIYPERLSELALAA